jgi:small subunit ribosomal protein S13
MPRVIGTDIPADKRLEVSLTYIYGIGRKLSNDIIKNLGLDKNMRAGKLADADVARLNAVLQSSYLVEGDLRRKTQNDVKRLIAIHSYRGMRHRLGLPVRGQRTRTNSRTRKGKRKTVANKKK